MAVAVAGQQRVADAELHHLAVVVGFGRAADHHENLLLGVVRMKADRTARRNGQLGAHPRMGAHFGFGFPEMFDCNGAFAAAHLFALFGTVFSTASDHDCFFLSVSRGKAQLRTNFPNAAPFPLV